MMHLRPVLDNLVANAVAHAPAGSVVPLTRDRDGPAAGLVIDNPLGAPLDASRLGETFYRADAARSGGDHCGLGLALCRSLVRLLGGSLALEAGDGRFRACVRLPARGWMPDDAAMTRLRLPPLLHTGMLTAAVPTPELT